MRAVAGAEAPTLSQLLGIDEDAQTDDPTERAAVAEAARLVWPTIESAGKHPLALTIEETSRLLGISEDSAYEAVKRGKLHALRFGTRIRVSKPALLFTLLKDSTDLSPRSPNQQETRWSQ